MSYSEGVSVKEFPGGVAPEEGNLENDSVVPPTTRVGNKKELFASYLAPNTEEIQILKDLNLFFIYPPRVRTRKICSQKNRGQDDEAPPATELGDRWRVN